MLLPKLITLAREKQRRLNQDHFSRLSLSDEWKNCPKIEIYLCSREWVSSWNANQLYRINLSNDSALNSNSNSFLSLQQFSLQILTCLQFIAHKVLKSPLHHISSEINANGFWLFGFKCATSSDRVDSTGMTPSRWNYFLWRFLFCDWILNLSGIKSRVGIITFFEAF